MHVAFVRPGMTRRPSADALQPLVFSVISAVTPDEVDITFHDGMVDEIPEIFEADAVAITVQTYTARHAYAIADRHRQRGIPVILGGYHPSACPEEAGEHADAVVIGDAEDTWPQVLADLAAGRLQPRYEADNHTDLAHAPCRTEPFRRRGYPPLGVVQFSRGCRYTCDFCSIHAFYGRGIRTKPLDVIVDEITARPEKQLFFVDDNLFADRQRARELFEALVPLRKRWVCQISMDIAEDAELLRLMRRAGCLMVLIGFESLDRDNLKQMRKGANLRAGDYQRVIDTIKRAGLMIYGTFVIGYDHDTVDTAGAIREFATRHGFSIANFNPLTPMPGTELFDRLRDEGRLLHDRWWLDENYRYGEATYVPARMSPAELTASCRAARFGFYSRRGIARRALANAGTPMRLGLHLAANTISRREIRAKQGELLGERR
ncbi:B12-binding domain-containing radical SAM protein [Enemella sp. A6]|uniref:B12-binding domain-containing radical SAM protein n=1 Tax=Enemella sp. A6 TaxID=3440152 RepID=UPI003EC1306A